MKNSVVLVCFVFALAGCGPEKNVRINGALSGSNVEKVYLHELGGERASKSDTVQLDVKGNFSFRFKISQPTFYSLTVNDKTITLLAHPGDRIFVRGDASQLQQTYQVEGSVDSQHIRLLRQQLEHATFVGDSLERTLKNFTGNRNYVNIQRQFQWSYINAVDSLKAFNIRFMEQYPRSLVVIYALYQKINPFPFLFNQELSHDINLFDDEDDITYFRRADSTFFRRYPKVSHVNMLRADVIRRNDQYNALRLNRMLYLLGQDAPEIDLPAPDGRNVKLSSLKGKFVLIDFWASWSAPCRTENINLLEIYNRYRDLGFEIYQVSLDQSKTAWERAIKEDALPWVNVSDFKFWDSDVVKAYGVETIPANFLVSREGSIITKNLKGDALENKLSEFFAYE